MAPLAPQPGEHILDVGCGTGHLTAEIAQSGAQVLGVDSSAAMVAQGRENFPLLRFETADVRALVYHHAFDAIFSNAVLHWVRPPETAAASIARALKPGGRLVLEFGGLGNTEILMEATFRALRHLGISHPERLSPWYYPNIAEYSAILENSGIEVTFAHLFDRYTPLQAGERGLENWFRMFGASFMEVLDDAGAREFLRLVGEFAASRLFADGQWTLDYRRLRIAGRKLLRT